VSARLCGPGLRKLNAVVVADATPLHYLILVDAVHVLPRLFERIYVPAEVRDELTCEATPALIRTWMRKSPEWLEVLAAPIIPAEDHACRRLTQVKERQLCSLLPFGPTFYSLMIARVQFWLNDAAWRQRGRWESLMWPPNWGLFSCRTFSYVCRKLTSGTHPHSWRRC